jgi:hypothetical protein
MTRSLLVVVALLALVAGGCGDARDPFAALDLAAKRSGEVDSIRQSITMETDLGGERMSLEGEGAFTADSLDGEMTATTVAGGEELEFELISVGGTMYMRSEALPLPKGKEWIKTADMPVSSMEPDELVNHLRESQGVTNVGTEEIRGEPTTHFRGPVDFEKLVEAAFGDDMAEQLKQLPDAEAYGIAVDVWVREDGLPARIGMKITAPENVGGAMTMTVDFLDYDVPIEVEAPPADKVIEESELAGKSS